MYFKVVQMWNLNSFQMKHFETTGQPVVNFAGPMQPPNWLSRTSVGYRAEDVETTGFG